MMDPMISAEKRTAMFRYRLFRRITTLIRYLEALTLTLVAVWSSARIPTAAKASGDFLRHSIIPVLLGPRFLFLLGNAIVLTLLFKSRHLTASTTTNYSNSDDDDDIIGNRISSFVPPPPPPPAASRPEEKVVVFEDKNVCVEASPHVDRTCRRSRSERIEPERRRADLRRSKTEVGKMKMKGDDEDAAEFRRVIEAFIEKQLKFQREESMAIVCPNPNPNPYAGTVVQVKEII